MTEIWRPVIRAVGLYEVSNEGRVRSFAGRKPQGWVLSPGLRASGYLTVRINGRTTDVHVLVAEAFHGPRPAPKDECRHLNGNSLDNRPENLAWGTRSENRRDSVLHGTHCKTAKTHCPAGHPYDEENTLYLKKDGSRSRHCRKCNAIKCRQRYARKRAGIPVRGLPSSCRNGHEYTPENTSTSSGYRRCRRCDADTAARTRRRIRNAAKNAATQIDEMSNQ